MVDDPDAKAGADARHLESCAECQSRLKTISDDANSVTTLLAVPDVNVDFGAALSRVRSAPQAKPAFGFRLPVARPGSRPLVLAFAAALAAVALLATVFAQNLQTFVSPSTVTPVPVTVADMQALSQLSDYGTITWTTQPQLKVSTSADEAVSVSGLQLPTVTLPSDISKTVTYAAASKGVAEFTFSSDKAAATAAKTGKAMPRLPAGIEGAKMTVTVGPAIAEIFGEMKQPTSSDITSATLPQLVIGKSVTPTASSTQVSVKDLEKYILQQPNISKELRDAITAIGDSSTTLPIPVPVQYSKSSTVQINGVNGVALGDETGLGAGVVWVKSGFVYAVAGTVKRQEAIDIASTLKEPGAV
jgi:hypothetical protein